MRITRCCALKVRSQEDLAYTESPVLGRLVGCKEELSEQAAEGGGDGKTVAGRSEEKSRLLQWREVPARAESEVFGQSRVLGSRGVEMSFTCLQTVDGVLCLGSERSTLYTCWSSQALPPGRAVAATLHVHWLGGWPASLALSIKAWHGRSVFEL
jgi:hypothetical protein